MCLTVVIRDNMTQAMKSGNKAEKGVYTTILAALTSKAKELQAELTAEQDTDVIMKLAKQNQESIDTCPASRTDILDTLKFERSIIVQYLPKQMDEAEILEVINGVLQSLDITTFTAKDKGRVMKDLMPLVKGKADGKLVNRVLATLV